MRLLTFVFCLIVLIASSIGLEKARYDNYRVYEFPVENTEQLKLLEAIEEFPDGYNFWNNFRHVIGSKIQLVVPPHKFGEFSELNEKFSLKAKLLLRNLQDEIDKQTISRRRSKADLDWSHYWTLDEINEWMDSLAASNPSALSTFSIGTSYEGRGIRGLKMNYGGETGKKAIFLEANIHANEWITSATATWIMNEFVSATEPSIQQLRDRYEWYFLPVLNVDGYAYTWSTDRLWRKTRGPTKNLLCKGADPNRNWDLFFSEFGASLNPCSHSYAGDHAFSEIEMKHLSEFVPKIPNLAAYFDFHSYGQLLMTPFAYSLEHLKNYDQLMEIGEIAVNALRVVNGKDYQLGTISSFFGRVAGSSFDWMNYNLNINISYCYEMRPNNNADGLGQILPDNEIIPNAREVFISLVAILNEAISRELA